MFVEERFISDLIKYMENVQSQ